MMDLNDIFYHANPAGGTQIPSLADIIDDGCSKGEHGLLCPDAKELLSTVQNDDSVTEKELALLFLDVRNYTELLQSQPAKDVIQTVKSLFNIFNKVIMNFGGRVIDRAGDSLYIVFGLKSDLKIAANDALLATKMLFDVLAYVNEKFAIGRYGYPLEIGAGLHAGEVIIEQHNEGDRYFSVMGLPVNIAARLQAETKKLDNDMIISDYLYALLDDQNKRSITGEKQSVSLTGIQAAQFIWLAGKAYVNGIKQAYLETELSYLLAIAG